MKIEAGVLLKVQTTTKDDVFGEVLWEVLEVGLNAPEKERAGEKDGVKCVLIGGSGPAARKGFTVIDSEAHIMADVEKKVTELLPASQKAILAAAYPENVDDGVHAGTGCHEVDM